MKALVLEEYNKFNYKEIEKPAAGKNDVLIKVKAVAICGSDVHGYDGSSGRRKPPLVLGHEASGVIESVGDNAKKFVPGDRVVFNSGLYCRDCYYCRRGKFNMCVEGRIFGVSCDAYHQEGAMCEYIAVPEYIVYKIPDSITFEQAALIEPVSIALHAINNTKISVNDNAVIFGAGTIGIMILKILKLTGCKQVFVVDIDESKLEMAKKIGADVCVRADKTDAAKEIRKLTGGRGADIAFEAVGINSTINSAIACLKKGGNLTVVGNISPKIEFPLQTVVINEIKITGSYGCNIEYETVIEILSSGRLDVSDCISAVAPLSEGQKWFDKLHAAEKGLLKVVLIP